MRSLQQFLCGIRGHEDYVRFEANRVYLQCVACGHESPGWTVDPWSTVDRVTSTVDRPTANVDRPAFDHAA